MGAWLPSPTPYAKDACLVPLQVEQVVYLENSEILDNGDSDKAVVMNCVGLEREVTVSSTYSLSKGQEDFYKSSEKFSIAASVAVETEVFGVTVTPTFGVDAEKGWEKSVTKRWGGWARAGRGNVVG